MSRSYLEVLDLIHQVLLPRTYLEIGVQNGYSLALAFDCTESVGVDPHPNVLVPLPRRARLERCTSDAFFAYKARTLFGSQGVDLVFIDGLHLFEYALRDFANSEIHSHQGSVVVLDDCLPRDREEASRQRRGVGWTGDVWKLLYCLREERPELDLTVVEAAPTGLAVIRGLDPESSEWFRDPDEVVGRYRDLEFEQLEQDLLPSLRVIDADDAVVRRALPTTVWQEGQDLEALKRARARRARSVATQVRRLKRLVLKTPVGAKLRSYLRSE